MIERRLLRELRSALTLRTITFTVALLLLTACDESVTGVVEEYRRIPGTVSLRAIGQVGSQCHFAHDGTLIGDPLENATVTAVHQSGDLSDMITATDAAGEARLDLLTGMYDIRIESEGFKPITVNGIIVIPDEEQSLGDVGLRLPGRGIDPPRFTQDRATLLAVMASIAYADGRPGYDKTIDSRGYGDALPVQGHENWQPTFEKYLGSPVNPCWTFVSFIEDTDTDTQLFVAKNEDTHDLVVSFRGTASLTDGVIDAAIDKVPWPVRDEIPAIFAHIDNAVHEGFRLAYSSVSSDIVRILDAEIKNVADTSTARVYFTGHSLGGALATLAALDLSAWLQGIGYQPNNVFMYSYGAPRSITTNLLALINSRVPNRFAVAARDDYVTHSPPRSPFPLPDSYTHLINLVVLSTNILNRNDDGDGRYTAIGDTRLEYRHNHTEIYRGCNVHGDPSGLDLDVTAEMGLEEKLKGDSAYKNLGHDQLQYITRLNNIASEVIPNIVLFTALTAADTLDLVLSWSGGVQGPCDWVALYQTDDNETPSPEDWEGGTGRTAVGIPPNANAQWVVNGRGYPLTYSQQNTGRNPCGLYDESHLFWMGYVDGFGRFLGNLERLDSSTLAKCN